jgi:glycosyltransferase involved in cell wall biosynthesis
MNDILPNKKAAHFLLIPELLYSPPNNAIINAYLENNYLVDVYSPGSLPKTTTYGENVRTFQISYSWFWLFRHVVDLKWVDYNCFSGTSEDPLVVVGILSVVYNKSSFSLVDEIKSGSYRGDRSEKWKKICQWAIRRSSFQIVNDINRISLLKEYAKIKKDHSIIVYPGCFTDIPMRDVEERKRFRKEWGLANDAFVIGSSGGFNMTAGADWLIDAIKEIEDIHAVIQPLGVSPLSIFLLQSLSFSDRIYVQTERLGWKEAWNSAQDLDIGLCIYTNQAPQFQKMGISSNRLCMFLAMGVPIIASYQKSFGFLEKYDCGIMVSNYEEFKSAILRIRRDYQRMSLNCQYCVEDFVRPREYYKVLKHKIRELR